MSNAGSFKKGEKRPNQGKRGPGKLTVTVKSVFEETFRNMQKDPKQPHALAQWSKMEPTEFYKLAAKLIPTELKGELTHNVKVPGIDVVASALGVPAKKGS